MNLPNLTKSSTGSVALDNQQCVKCGLCKTRSKVVNGFGNTHAKIMFVSDAMSDYEESIGKPLQGLNKQLFDKLLRDAGINRQDVFITTVLRCKGKSASLKDQQESVDACLDYLDQEIDTIRPNVIVPLGSLASKAIFRSKTVNITRARGIVQYSDRYSCKILPIFHPAYLMQMPAYERVTIQDLTHVLRESTTPDIIPPKVGDWKAITTVDQFDKFMDEYRSAKLLASDVEATGANWLTDKIIGISFSNRAGVAVYIPFVKGEGDLSDFWGGDQKHILDGCRELLEGPSGKMFHNGPYDIKILRQDLGIVVKNFVFDTMLADHLLDENARGLHGLENCALRYTEFGSYKQPVVKWFTDKKIPAKSRDYNLLPPKLLYPYGAADSDCTFTLRDIFEPLLKQQNLTRLFYQVIMPTQNRFIETEFRGVEIDRGYLQGLEKKFTQRLLDLEQEIYKMVGDFKITSPKELQRVLFDDLGLPPIKKTKSGKWAVDKEVLAALQGRHPVIELILEYKLTSKLQSTYVKGLQKKLDPNNRLHTSYLLTGTATGRQSSRNPNLQNIPSRTNDIQNAFVAGDGNIFIAADYAQAEFRAWANFCRDPQMLYDCSQGAGFDVHREIASVVFGISADKINKDQRSLAKTVTFGGIYGRGPNSIAAQFGVSREEAVRIITYIKRRYPLGFRWIAKQKSLAMANGQVRTLFGRIRHLRAALNSFNEEVRAKAQRLAVNSPIQGTIGDLNSIAALRVLDRFEKEKINGYLALTIHDALIFSVDKTQQAEASVAIKEEMERPISGFTVPMRVDIQTGERWGDVRTLDEESVVEDEDKSADDE